MIKRVIKRVMKKVIKIVIKIVIKRWWFRTKVINYGLLAILLTDYAKVT